MNRLALAATLAATSGCRAFDTLVLPVSKPRGVDLALYGRTPNGNTGLVLAGGDVTGDGVADLVVGAPNEPFEGGPATITVWTGPWLGVADHVRDTSFHLELGKEAALLELLVVEAPDSSGRPALVAMACARGSEQVWTASSPLEPGRLDLLLWETEGDECSSRLLAGSGDRDGDGSVDLVLWSQVARGSLLLTRGLPDGRATDRLDAAAGEFEDATQVVFGDLDGDGAPDLVVGAPGEDTVYVFLHDVVGAESTADADLTIEGDALDRTGEAVAMVDLDGDGDLDLAVGAPDAGGGAGEIRVWFGPLSAARAPDLQVLGAPTVRFGARLQPFDLDGDGAFELAAFSRPYSSFFDKGQGGIVRGPESAWYLLRPALREQRTGVWDLAQEPVDRYTGFEDDLLGGGGIVSADFDGDGIPDLAAGAPASAIVGAAYLWRGVSLR